MNGLMPIPQHGKIDHVLDVLNMAQIFYFFCHLKVSTPPPELPELGGLRVRSRAIRSAGPVAQQSLQEIQHSSIQ